MYPCAFKLTERKEGEGEWGGGMKFNPLQNPAVVK